MSDVFYVNLKLLDGRTFKDTKLPKDSTVQEILDMVIDLFSFPLTDNEGNAVTYFFSLDSKQPLSNFSTITDAGIKDGDIVSLKTINDETIPPTILPSHPVPPGHIRITVHVPECNFHEAIDLSTNKSIGDLITQIIDEYKLPTFDEMVKDHIVYKVKSKALGKFFPPKDSRSVEDAEVPSGDTWIFNRRFDAGCC